MQYLNYKNIIHIGLPIRFNEIIHFFNDGYYINNRKESVRK